MEKTIFIIYLAVINLIGFALMFIDKRIAIVNGNRNKNIMRIPEETLLCIAFIFGAVGSYIGMRVFHHKTRKWKFNLIVPFFILCNIVLAYYIFRALI